MKIIDLPQDLQKLAIKEAKLQGFKKITIEDDLMLSFSWRKSCQGINFWENINNGNFSVAAITR